MASRIADPELSIVVSIAGPDLRTARETNPARTAREPPALAAPTQLARIWW